MFLRYTKEVVEAAGRAKVRFVPDASNLSANQLTFRRIDRNGIIYLFEEGGRVKPNVSFWVTQVPPPAVVENLEWRSLNRNISYSFDEGGRATRWIPSSSSLNNDQIPWLSAWLKNTRNISYTFPEAGRTANWQPDNSFLNNDQIPWLSSWLKRTRNIDYSFLEGNRGYVNLTPWLAMGPAVIDLIGWRPLKRAIEYNFTDGVRRYISPAWYPQQVSIDYLPWAFLHRGFTPPVSIEIQARKSSNWLPIPLPIIEYLPWKKLSKFNETITTEVFGPRRWAYLDIMPPPPPPPLPQADITSYLRKYLNDVTAAPDSPASTGTYSGASNPSLVSYLRKYLNDVG